MFFSRSQAKTFDRLVQPHLRGLYRFALRLTGNPADAEDLVQEVMLKLFPRTHELEEVADLRPWMNRVLYRQFVDDTRRRSRRHEDSLTDVLAGGDPGEFLDRFAGGILGPMAEMNEGQVSDCIRAALDGLSPDQRTLVILHDMEGWGQADIAEVLDVAQGTIKSRLHRCRQQLRKKLLDAMEPFERSSREP